MQRSTHHELRSTTLAELRAMMSTKDLDGVASCASRLRAALPIPEELEHNTVLVAYSGGKDSSYTLAFVRTMQLILSQIYGSTFRMRVATNRHAGMPHAVMENIDRAYHALRLFGDPECELLTIDGSRISTFAVNEPQHADVVRRNRIDILMTGHRTAADARPTFCNACNLSVVNSFGLAAGYGEGVDLIITGDSPQEQRRYSVWVAKLARRVDPQPQLGERSGIKGFLGSLNNISQAYFSQIHGSDAVDMVSEHSVATDVPNGLRFFSIYDDTAYASGDHWELLTEFLGFRFDDIAFSFTESDCGNPSLMAHLRALKSERRYGRSYAEGLAEYVEFAISLMRQKEFPSALIDIMRARYEGSDAAKRMRASMDSYALEAYGLTEEQLVGMVYAPFVEQGAGLDRYLSAEQPELAPQIETIRVMLANEADRSIELRHQNLLKRLGTLSGLTLDQLRVLYNSSLRLPSLTPAPGELIDSILEGDPHKRMIQTRQQADGPLVPELLSGR